MFFKPSEMLLRVVRLVLERLVLELLVLQFHLQHVDTLHQRGEGPDIDVLAHLEQRRADLVLRPGWQLPLAARLAPRAP